MISIKFVTPLSSPSEGPMKCSLAAGAVLSLAFLPFALTQNSATPTADVLVLEQPGNQWYEGPLTHVTISLDGNRAVFFSGLGRIQLYSLATGRADPETLRDGLDHLDAAGFCGPGGFIRVGTRGTESGIFFQGRETAELSSLPSGAIPVCSPDGNEIAFYKASAPERAIFVGARNNYHDYPLSGKVTSMAFSRDGEVFYYLVFQPNGESSLVRIEVRTGKTRTIAGHLDASPIFGPIAIAPDGKHAYLALASDGAPNNEARHNPEADRWLKIYEIDLATGAHRRIVESLGQDNSGPEVVGDNLYWTRTVVRDSIVVVPVAGGNPRGVIAGGELPMWSPDGKRIAYTFGGWRLADWALNLDDAVVTVDENVQRTSEPSVIVSGYHEDFPPAWSPDGKWIAFHSHRSQQPVPEYSSPGSTDDVYLRRANDVHAPEIRLTDFGWETGPAYWSPDGRKLLFHSWQRGGKPGIDKLFVLTMDTETGAALKADMLTLGPEIRSAVWSAWSPDGQEIAIEDDGGAGKRSLWIVHSDGSHPQKLLDYEGTTHGGLDWTRDGKAIVFAGLSGDRVQLFSERRTGGEPLQLTHDSGNLMHPRVSPDGRWIACTRIVQSKQIWRRPL
jgi:Tol biopolymer transport system component